LTVLCSSVWYNPGFTAVAAVMRKPYDDDGEREREREREREAIESE
jgi:hypothetical protein